MSFDNVSIRNAAMRRATRFALIGLLAMAPVSLVACSQGNKPESSEPAASEPAPADTQASPGNAHAQGHTMAIDLGPSDESFDLRFIDAMILHHQGAIRMSRQASQRSTRPEIKAIAEEIIQAQQKEIRQLNAWRNSWYADAGEQRVKYDAATQQTVAMSDEDQEAMMMGKRLGQPNERFDRRYIRAMLPHHRAAVQMAREALQKSERPQIKRLARQIIDTQVAEMEQLREWQKAWYGSGAPDADSAQ